LKNRSGYAYKLFGYSHSVLKQHMQLNVDCFNTDTVPTTVTHARATALECSFSTHFYSLLSHTQDTLLPHSSGMPQMSLGISGMST